MGKQVVIEQEELDYIDRLGMHYREHPEDFRKISPLRWVDGYLVGTYEPDIEETHDGETMEVGLEVNQAEPRSADSSTWTGEEEDTHDDGSSMEAKLEEAQDEPDSNRLPAWMNDESHTEERDLESLGEGGRKLLSTLHGLRRQIEERPRIREGLTALVENVERELLGLCRMMEQDRAMRRMIDEVADCNDEEERVLADIPAARGMISAATVRREPGEPGRSDLGGKENVAGEGMTEGELEVNQAEPQYGCRHTIMVEGTLAKRPRDNIADGSHGHLVDGSGAERGKVGLPIRADILPWRCTKELYTKEVTTVEREKPVVQTLKDNTLDRPGGLELVRNDSRKSKVCRGPSIQEEGRETHRQNLEERRLGRWTGLMDGGPNGKTELKDRGPNGRTELEDEGGPPGPPLSGLA
jgi:hypothetical protein